MANFESARKQAGFTRDYVHKMIGIPINTQNQWAAGRRKPSQWVENLVVKEIRRLRREKKNEISSAEI